MAILHRIASAPATGAASPITVSSTGIVAGDTVILAVRLSAAISPDTPSGFIPLADASIVAVSGLHIFYKIAGSSEPATYSITFASGTGRVGLEAIYSDAGSPVVPHAMTKQVNAASTTYNLPSVTTTVANTLITYFASFANVISFTPEVALTQRYDVGSGNAAHCATMPLAAAGASSARTATGGSSASSVATIAWQEWTSGARNPVVRGVSSSAALNSTSQIFTKPGGTVEGDEMLIELYINGTAQPATSPTGWTKNDEIATGSTLTQYWSKVAGASEPADYTFTWAVSVIKAGGVITVCSESNQPVVIDVSAQQNNSSTSLNRVCPSVTPTAPALLVMFIVAGIGQAMTPDALSTERWDFGSAPRCYCMTEAVAAGATGTRTATGASVSISQTFTIALIESAASRTATLAVTLADATLTATGELAITASLTATLADATLTATGELGRLGSLAVTLDDAELAAAGEAYQPGIQLRSFDFSYADTSDTLIFDLPSGVQEGDILVVQIATTAAMEFSTLTPPSGWTWAGASVETGITDGGYSDSGYTSWLYTKTAGASEPADYTFTWPGAVTRNGVILAFYSETDLPA